MKADFPDLTEEPLDQSRRSSPVVIDAVNRIFQGLGRHGNLDKDEDFAAAWSTRFPTHTTAKNDAAGYVRLETPQLTDDKDQAIATLAANRVAEYSEQSPWATIGILTRKNDAIPLLIHELAKLGITASEEGGVSLTKSAGVRVILSALTFADHPGDSVARFHVASSRLGELIGLRIDGPARQAEVAASTIRAELIERGYEAVVARWVSALRPDCDVREWSRLRQLLVLAAEYEQRATLRPGDFVRWVERKRVEDASQSNVRVMTIHKAKGLEFDIVVLPELDWPWFQNPDCVSRAPAPGQPTDAVLLYRSQELAQLLPPELRSAYDEDRRRQVEGGLCCLYVAVTRAVHVLHMIVPPDPDAAKFPKKADGLVRAALTESPAAPAETTLFSLGNPDWHVREHFRKPAAISRTRERVLVPPPIVLASSERGRTRGRATVAPSRGKEEVRIPTTSLLAAGREKSTDRGTLWHAWCQEIEWIESGPPNEAALRKAATRLDRVESEIATEIADFLKTIDRPALKRMLSRARYRDRSVFGLPKGTDADDLNCFRERAFTVIDDGRHLSGTIDRLVLLMQDGRPVAAEIIDFKTDASGDKSGLREAYVDQLRLYARAVQKAYDIPLERIMTSLAWLTTGVVEMIGSPAHAPSGCK
jgi:ATP-dependent exoDNAse (exonuclease V) beta subunit